MRGCFCCISFVMSTYLAQAIAFIEWAEFALYYSVAPLIFTNIQSGFLILGLGFLLRPLGAILFAYTDKVYAIKISTLLMIIASFMFVISPGQQNAIFFWWILLCRSVQSFALKSVRIIQTL